MMRHVSCILLLEWSTTSQRLWVYRICPLCTKKIPDSYSKREGGIPGNSGLSSQQYLVVHYPRTVWKNSYAEHEVTGKTYPKKKEKKKRKRRHFQFGSQYIFFYSLPKWLTSVNWFSCESTMLLINYGSDCLYNYT